jgi:serine/threonine-protein kinase RsbW
MSQSPNLSAQFRLNGELSELPRLAAEVQRFCHAESLGDSAAFSLNLVLEELFANVVTHGGCGGMNDAVTVRLRRDSGGALAIEFVDRGAPFDPSTAPAPDLAAPLAERQAGGLGLHFVRTLARIVQYRRDGGWNRLELRLPLEPL